MRNVSSKNIPFGGPTNAVSKLNISINFMGIATGGVFKYNSC